MSFEEDHTPHPTIHDLLIKARDQVGVVAKTGRADDGNRSFGFLGIKDVVIATRDVFNDLGIVVKLKVLPDTYKIQSIGQGQYMAVSYTHLTLPTTPYV